MARRRAARRQRHRSPITVEMTVLFVVLVSLVATIIMTGIDNPVAKSGAIAGNQIAAGLQGQSVVSGVVTIQPLCKDTDRLDLSTKGSCTSANGTKTDYCWNNASVVEYTCLSNTCAQNIYTCANYGFTGGCVDGACVNASGHLACVGLTCSVVPGSGGDLCSVNADCTPDTTVSGSCGDAVCNYASSTILTKDGNKVVSINGVTYVVSVIGTSDASIAVVSVNGLAQSVAKLGHYTVNGLPLYVLNVIHVFNDQLNSGATLSFGEDTSTCSQDCTATSIAYSCGNAVCQNLDVTQYVKDGEKLYLVNGNEYRMKVVGTSDVSNIVLSVNGLSSIASKGLSKTINGLDVFVVDVYHNISGQQNSGGILRLGENSLTCSDCNNNTNQSLPDLTVTTLTAAVDPANQTSNVMLTATIANVGTAAASVSTTDFAVVSITGGGMIVIGKSYSTPSIPAGGQWVMTGYFNLTAGKTYNATVVADSLHVVTELNEGNNAKTITFAV
ncbi:MAG: hypothetical protein HY369_05170 [Candidatus Aenigmarchaeota archaeon]|nr:hypothetical protein [Candidatus Aenigmarchaeota archaeon]